MQKHEQTITNHILFGRKKPAQVLISTLLMLMIISLTVMVISGTVRRNSTQVFNNLEYEKSYNYAEAKILETAEILARPNLVVSEPIAVRESLADAYGLESCNLVSERTVCTFSDEGGKRRTILQIEEVNYVESYELGKEEYFDILLTNGQSDYRNSIIIDWLGDSALELSLLYTGDAGASRVCAPNTGANEYCIVTQIVDPSSVRRDAVFNTVGPTKAGSTSGFLTQNPIIDSNTNSIRVNLGAINDSVVPITATLRYLRVKSVNRTIGSSISIQPEAAADSSFPNQVRRIEAFSYDTALGASAAPVVITQLPLSPQLPAPFTFPLNFQSFRTPICGNQLVEGAEKCDDGNICDDDPCPSDCLKCKVAFDVLFAIDASASIRKVRSDVISAMNDFINEFDFTVARMGIMDQSRWENRRFSGFIGGGNVTEAQKNILRDMVDYASSNPYQGATANQSAGDASNAYKDYFAQAHSNRNVYKILVYLSDFDRLQWPSTQSVSASGNPVQCVPGAKAQVYNELQSLYPRNKFTGTGFSSYLIRFTRGSAAGACIENTNMTNLMTTGNGAEAIFTWDPNSINSSQNFLQIFQKIRNDVCIPELRNCSLPGVCGNNILELNEDCDSDSERAAGTCSSVCTSIYSSCGDSSLDLDELEQCDDGNRINNDGCSATCDLECGNGLLNSSEQCDDGNRVNNDGCSSTCELEIVFSPTV